MSTLKVNNIQAESGTTINVASGNKITGSSGSIVTPGQVIQIITGESGSGTASMFTFNGAARLGCIGAAITPKFTNSKILITGFVHGFINSGGSQCGLGLELVSHPTTTFKDGSSVASATQLFGHQDTLFLNTGSQLMGNMPFQFEHSPGSIATIHYSVAISENAVYAAGTSQVNWSNGTTGGRSKIMLTEIAQ